MRKAAEAAGTAARATLAALCERIPAAQRARIRALAERLRLDRPAEALPLLWPAWWALWLAAQGFPPLAPFLLITLGVFVTHAGSRAGTEFFQPGAAASARRESFAVLAGAILAGVLLLLPTNTLTMQLAVAGLVLAGIGRLLRRAAAPAAVVHGVVLAWFVPLVFAILGAPLPLPPLCWLLLLAGLLLALLRDTANALARRGDEEPGRQAALAGLFAGVERPVLGILAASFLLAMALVGSRGGLGWGYWPALLLAAGLLVQELRHLQGLEPAACRRTARAADLAAGVLWLGIVLGLLF